MQESKQVFSAGQQTKLQELQIEITALEKQLENILKQRSLLELDRVSEDSAISLIYANEQVARSGIKLTHETV